MSILNCPKNISVISFSKIFPKALNLVVINLHFLDINLRDGCFWHSKQKDTLVWEQRLWISCRRHIPYLSFSNSRGSWDGASQRYWCDSPGLPSRPRQTSAAGTPLPTASCKWTLWNKHVNHKMALSSFNSWTVFFCLFFSCSLFPFPFLYISFFKQKREPSSWLILDSVFVTSTR